MANNRRQYEKLLADYDRHARRIAKATTIDINETPKEKLDRIKWLEEDYIRWFEYFFPNYAKKKSAKHHHDIADILINNTQTYLLLEAYRSAGKTVHICMGIPLFLYFKKMTSYVIIMGQTIPKAQRLLSGVQLQLKFNLRLINDYGERFKIGDWAEGDLSTTDGVRFRSFGFGESPRGEQEEGQRPDYIAVDDSDIKKHLNNDRIMGEREDFVFEDLIGCFDSADDAIKRFVFANNNFHKKSLTNRLKKRFKEAQIKAIAKKQRQRSGERKERHLVPTGKFRILSIPAVKDLVNFEPTWPEKTTSEYWRDLYDELGHRSFCREYMHIHVAEGAIFKAEHMQWKPMLPLRMYEALVFYGDLSYTDAGDFKAMVLVGKYKRELHIIFAYVRRGSKTDVAKWLYDLYEDENLHLYNITYQIEGLFAQNEFISDFDIEGDERGWNIPVIADKRGKEDKYNRIASMEGLFQRRWVFFNDAEKEHADQIELLDQLYAFEKGSEANDDGPDALHGAISNARIMAHQEAFDPRVGSADNAGNANLY